MYHESQPNALFESMPVHSRIQWLPVQSHVPLLLQVWSARLYEQLGRHVGHVGPVTCLALDGNFLLSGGEDCSVRLWDLVPSTRYSLRHPSIHASVHPCVHLSVHPSIRVSVCLSVQVPVSSMDLT